MLLCKYVLHRPNDASAAARESSRHSSQKGNISCLSGNVNREYFYEVSFIVRGVHSGDGKRRRRSSQVTTLRRTKVGQNCKPPVREVGRSAGTRAWVSRYLGQTVAPAMRFQLSSPQRRKHITWVWKRMLSCPRSTVSCCNMIRSLTLLAGIWKLSHD